MINIGDVKLQSLTDDHGSGHVLDIFPDSDLEVWETKYSELLHNDNHIQPRFGSTFLYSQGKNILVDTGGGPPSGKLLKNLKNVGIKNNEIDIVVLTHLHPDHVGWNVLDNQPTFQSAKYIVSSTDLKYWKQDDVASDSPHISDQVDPLIYSGVIEVVEDNHKITSDVTVLSTPGHTPGHISLELNSKGQKGFILGDVAHSPAQAAYTDWSPSFDVDPDLARITRHKILNKLEKQGHIVSAGHFPEPGLGVFKRESKVRYWVSI